MSIPLQLAVYGGLIPAAVAALVFCVGALATRRAPWSRAAWAGVAMAVGFVAANVLLGDSGAPWIPRSSRDWLPPLAVAGALVCVVTARFGQAWIAWLGCGALAALAGSTLVPNYAELTPQLNAWRAGVAGAALLLSLLSRWSARHEPFSLAAVLAASFVGCAVLIEHSGGLSLAQLAGAGCAVTAAVTVCGWLLGTVPLPPAAAPLPAVLLVGLAAQGYFEGFGVRLHSFALLLMAPAAFTASGALRGKLSPRMLAAVRLGFALLLLAAAVASALIKLGGR